MRNSDLLSMCLRNLARRKFRTVLTLVGVVAGTCAVILMIAIGLGMQATQDANLAQMGDLTLINVYSYGMGEGAPVMNDEQMNVILDMDHVVAATPFYYPRYLDGQLTAGRNGRYSTYMYETVGVYPEAMEVFGYELVDGSWEGAFDEPYSIVVGEYFAYSFRDTRKKSGNSRIDRYMTDANGNVPDPYFNIMEEKLTFTPSVQSGSGTNTGRKREYKVNVSAVMKENWNLGYYTSQGAFMNVKDLIALENEYVKLNKLKDTEGIGNYNEVIVKVDDINNVEAVQTAIADMGFETYSMESIRKPMQEQTQQIQLFLGLIAGVSLFVAALGIINTMLMSVYERTREIGIMKVVGCKVRDIRSIFLIEAGFIGLLGGILGTLLSCLIAYLCNKFGFSIDLGVSSWYGSADTKMFIITPWLVALALVFSTLIGVISGFAPANRAVKIPALTAIKHE